VDQHVVVVCLAGLKIHIHGSVGQFRAGGQLLLEHQRQVRQKRLCRGPLVESRTILIIFVKVLIVQINPVQAHVPNNLHQSIRDLFFATKAVVPAVVDVSSPTPWSKYTCANVRKAAEKAKSLIRSNFSSNQLCDDKRRTSHPGTSKTQNDFLPQGLPLLNQGWIGSIAAHGRRGNVTGCAATILAGRPGIRDGKRNDNVGVVLHLVERGTGLPIANVGNQTRICLPRAGSKGGTIHRRG